MLIAFVANACGSSDTPGAPSDAGAADASLACRESVTDYCLLPDVVCRWPSDSMAFCPLHPSSVSISVGTCGPYNAVLRGGIDTQTFDYYDMATGQLVAAVTRFAAAKLLRCDAGPAAFVDPCPTYIGRDVVCPDGGIGPGGAGAPEAGVISFAGGTGTGGSDGGR